VFIFHDILGIVLGDVLCDYQSKETFLNKYYQNNLDSHKFMIVNHSAQIIHHRFIG